ncbi:hypothetical protein PVV74_02710 [Roseovarius sp. SK2]|uniref:hypothetical protein n=1 Tax=Roseovarius TaxID=74030 RepID=UPI00237B5CA6|nr:hypothetical protein [Roseovarius sp. SK2]MDD9724359.1 hypothetical protein [Roseovarius sp. SK2]
MRILKPILVALAATVTAGPALADGKLYPYHSKENYCPGGLQPVSLGGMISCGTPNQSQSYRQVMQHPVPKKKHYVHKARRSYNCPEGQKGCF